MGTRAVKIFLDRFGMLSPLRRIGYGGCPPDWLTRLEAETRFYRQFVRAGDLCFDIGANIGAKADSFLALGARIVCVEPGPAALETLRAKFSRDPSVTIVPKAVGANEGVADMQVGDNTTTSTLSRTWQERISRTDRMAGRTWPSSVAVPLTTLDVLIAEHGLPDFCKIDVEGFESEVIQGLSQPLPSLSFEFHPAALDVALSVIDRLKAFGGYCFNFSFAEPLRLESRNWVDATGIRHLLEEARSRSPEAYGDIFARSECA